MTAIALSQKTASAELTDALETLLRIELRITRYQLDNTTPLDDGTLAHMWNARNIAHKLLDDLISKAVGRPTWCVLLAGHLIYGEEGQISTVTPIEKVTRLDNLRRFP